jgi:hypothetical protein
MGPCIHKHERGRGVGGQKCETERDGLVSGLSCYRTVGDVGGYWWGCSQGDMVVMGPRVHKRKRGRGVGGQKPETEHDGSVSGSITIRVLRGAGGFREVGDPPAAVI